MPVSILANNDRLNLHAMTRLTSPQPAGPFLTSQSCLRWVSLDALAALRQYEVADVSCHLHLYDGCASICKKTKP